MDSIKTLAFTVAILLFLGGGILTLLGGGDGTWKVSGVEQVLWPRDRVFQWITEPDHRKEWVEGLTATTIEPDGRLRKGARLVESAIIDGVSRTRTLEVTEYEEDSVFAYRTSEDGVEVEARFEVRYYQTSEQTRIDYEYKVQFPGWSGRVMEPLLGRKQRAKFDREFGRLTSIIMPAS